MKINQIIKYLIFSDLVFWSGWGLIAPVLAIFITNQIEGGSPMVAGMASGVYWILKSILRVPFGVFLDNRRGEEDDYLFMTFGLFVAALVPFTFLLAQTPWHLYFIQAIHAVGTAMSLSGWCAIFTRHLDKDKEATEWGLDATSVGMGMGISGIIGGWAVQRFGFDIVFLAVGIIELAGASLLLLLKNKIGGPKDRGFYFSLKEVLQKEEKA